MLSIIKKSFVLAFIFIKNSLLTVKTLECMSMSNQKCRARPKIIDVNANDPVFHRYSIKVNKCSGSRNNINNPYAKLCIPDIIKKINVKVSNLFQGLMKLNKYCGMRLVNVCVN